MKPTDQYDLGRPGGGAQMAFDGLIVPSHWIRALLIASTALFVTGVLASFAGMSLGSFLGLSLSGVFEKGFFWQPLSYALFHDQVLLLLVNLLVLWLFGSEVERALGGRKFLRLCAVAVVGVGLVHLAAMAALGHPRLALMGFDGLVFGLLTAYGMLFPDRVVTLLLLLVFPLQVRARWLVVIFGLIELLMGLGGRAGAASLVGLAAVPLTWAALGGATRLMARIRPAGKLAVPSLSGAGEQRNDEVFIRDQIDPILDKISREGFQSLNAKEKKILNQAREIISARLAGGHTPK